jgi:FkbM family methyltransferase
MQFESYVTQRNFAGTGFKFGIFDEVAKSWYDDPAHPRTTFAPQPMKQGLAIDTGWREMDLFRRKIATPGSVLLDCGCHHGLTTVLASAWVGETGFVHAFDAVLDNAYFTKQNLYINKVTNAAVHCAGLSNKFGFAGMHHDSNVVLDHKVQWTSRTAITVRVSSFFEIAPDAAKIDIEGFELEVLEGEREFFASISRLLVEVHSDYMPLGSPNKLAEIINRPIEVLFSDGQTAPYDSSKDYKDRCHFLVY